MSMKPGVTRRPDASISRVPSTRGAISTIRPSDTPTSARTGGEPVPSTTVPPRIASSALIFSAYAARARRGIARLFPRHRRPIVSAPHEPPGRSPMADVRTSPARFELPGFAGELLHPGDPGYDDARAVFNGMIDRHPVLIARCANADDVVAAVKLARAESLPLSVYGGGHGVTGAAVCDGGACVDLRGMEGGAVATADRTGR